MVRRGALMEGAALADIARRRSRTYWLLSRLVLEAPSVAFIAELAAVLGGTPIDVEVPLGAETLALRDSVCGLNLDPAALGGLNVERTRLFAGLGTAYGAPPPYESVFRESKLPGAASIAVAAAYADAGFDLAAPEAGPADHLGSELRLLALLCHRESDAWAAEERAQALAIVERERAFLDDHVLQWAPQHCERLLAVAESAYHRAMLTLIARACLIDRDDVAELPLHGARNIDEGRRLT